MTDARTRITEALREHQFSWSDNMDAHCRCGTQLQGWPRWTAHATDVLLSLPGLDVVNLRAELLKFCYWVLEGEIGEGREEEILEKYLTETRI